jgi:tRNA-(ms[2]io[6]A)-hydroxylase
VSGAAAPFAHPLLRAATPAAWVEQACATPDVLMIDHANCEKKAASTALALMFAYAEDLELTGRMSRLAREELRHYEQVAKLMSGTGMALRRLAPGRYAERLRRLVARSEPQREVDLMICGALIEARSCERFAALAPAIGAPWSELFLGLHNAEARHYKVYLDLARRAARRAEVKLSPRVEEFAALEAELITSPDPEFRFHSGPPEHQGCHRDSDLSSGPPRLQRNTLP